MLGLPGIADLIEDAVRLAFPRAPMPLDQDRRLAALDALTDAELVVSLLDPLERTYDKPGPELRYRDNHELLPLMCWWIDQHPDRFFAGL